jgi:sulfur carrier protein
MTIYLNDKPYTLPSGNKLSEFLKGLDLESLEGTAVALNGTIVYRSRWNSVELEEDDHLLLIQAAQGG